MKKFYFGLPALALILFIFWKNTPQNSRMAFLDKGAIRVPGGEEEEEGRAEWERARLADPATGRIPEGIEFLERQFVAGMPRARVGLRSGPGSEWVSRGPWNVGGRTRAMAIDVTDENRIFAGGVSSGLWLSTDGGNTWRRKTPLSAHPGCVSIAQDTRPGHTDTWYYISGEITGTSASGGAAFYLGDGMFKSTDGGETWAPLDVTDNGGPQSFATDWQSGWRVVTDPTNAAQDVVYAATYGTIYRSSNGGSSFTAVRGGPNVASSSYYTDLAISPTGVLYATFSSEGGHRGVWRSLNGTQWTNIMPPAIRDSTEYERIVIGINPNNENEVYFLASTPGYGHVNHYIDRDDWSSLWKYTYLSGDGDSLGGQWVDLSQNLPNTGTQFDKFACQGGYDLVVKVQPATNYVFIGGTNIYRSTDGFSSTNNTTHIGGYKPGTNLPYFELYPEHHPDQHDLLFLPSNPNVLFSASDGGMRRTANCNADTVLWTSLNKGYQTTQFYTAFVEHTIPGDNTLIGGLQDNGNFFVNSADSTAPWKQTINGDGAFGAIADGKAFYILSIQQGRVAKCLLDNDGNVTAYERIDPIGRVKSDYLFINPLALDPVNQNILYLPAGRYFYRQDDLSAITLTNNWDSISQGWVRFPDTLLSIQDDNEGHNFSAIGVSQANPAHRVYLGTTRNKIFRVDNADSGTPTLVSLPSPSTSGTAYVTCLAVDPANADRVILVYSNYSTYSIYLSDDAGASWKKVAGNLENNITGSGSSPSVRWVSILPLPNGGRQYFCGTSAGLFAADSLILSTVTPGSGTKWVLQSPDKIGTSVVDYVEVRPVDGLVVAATHGMGMFSANFPVTVGGFEPSEQGSEVLVWPNPARTEAWIKGNGTSETEIRLFNAQGRLVREGHGRRIDLQNLPNGVYYYALQGKGWKKSGKLVKTE